MIDLDGVLNNYSKYEENNIPDIKQGAKEFLEQLYRTNKYDMVVFTSRKPELAVEWLNNNSIAHYFKEVTNIKKPASIYIDDRALKFNGDYMETIKEIEKFKVYWK
jgi:phosphoglycolate phosphatase-like HAD superfamily hydrolase